MWRYADKRKFTNIMEEHTASIFGVEKYTEIEVGNKQTNKQTQSRFLFSSFT
jgi:hypothetical protein